MAGELLPSLDAVLIAYGFEVLGEVLEGGRRRTGGAFPDRYGRKRVFFHQELCWFALCSGRSGPWVNLKLRSLDSASALLFEKLLDAIVFELQPVEAVVQMSNVDCYPIFAEGYRRVVPDMGVADAHEGPVLYPGNIGYFEGVEELRYVRHGAFIQAGIDPTEFAARTGRTCRSCYAGLLFDGDWSTRWKFPKQFGGVA